MESGSELWLEGLGPIADTEVAHGLPVNLLWIEVVNEREDAQRQDAEGPVRKGVERCLSGNLLRSREIRFGSLPATYKVAVGIELVVPPSRVSKTKLSAFSDDVREAGIR